MNTERDKFLSNILDVVIHKACGSGQGTIKYTDFSTWDGFGKLLSWIRSDKAPPELYKSLVEISEQTFIFDYMYPNELADFTYEWLKEMK